MENPYLKYLETEHPVLYRAYWDNREAIDELTDSELQLEQEFVYHDVVQHQERRAAGEDISDDVYLSDLLLLWQLDDEINRRERERWPFRNTLIR